MAGYSGAGAVAPTVQQIEDKILDAFTVNHNLGSTVGQSLHMLRNLAIAGSITDSLMDKIRGATTGQVFATSSGNPLTNIVVRISTIQDITTTITPAVGEHQHFMLFVPQANPAAILIIQISDGVNFVDIGDLSTSLGSFINRNADALVGNLLLNSDSSFRWINPATNGTYIVSRIGTAVS